MRWIREPLERMEGSTLVEPGKPANNAKIESSNERLHTADPDEQDFERLKSRGNRDSEAE